MALDPNLSGKLPTEETDDLDFDECLLQITELAGEVQSLLKGLVEGKGVPGPVLESISATLTGLADEVGYQWQSCNDPDELCPMCGGTGTVDYPDEAAVAARSYREATEDYAADNYGDSYRDLL